MARPNLSYLKNLVLGLVGLAVGSWSGFTGMGAGPVLTPLSQWLLGLKDRRLSALVIVVTLISAALGIVAYGQNHDVVLIDAVSFAVVSIIGATIGASPVLAVFRDTKGANLLWASLILLLGTWLVHDARSIALVRSASEHTVVTLALAAFLAGFMGRIANLGGALAVPVLLLLYGDTPLVAQSTSLIVLIIVSIPPTFVYATSGEVSVSSAVWVGLGAAFGALIGAREAVQHRPSLLVEIYGIGAFCLGFYRLFLTWSMRAVKPEIENS